jgi:ABC-type amino acid transport substrate-binding protein
MVIICMVKFMWRYFILPLFFLVSCASPHSPAPVTLAVDSQWNSLGLPGRQAAVQAFTVEALEAIFSDQAIKFVMYDEDWDKLQPQLDLKLYDGILTNLNPLLHFENRYTFSNSYLLTGLALIVPNKSPATSLNELSDAQIAVIAGANLGLISSTFPGMIQKVYDYEVEALTDLTKGSIDAILMNILQATAYSNNLYHGQLRIVQPPLTQDGLRLMCLKEDSSHLIESFNKGLKRIKMDGTYHKIAQKWGLAVSDF